MTTTNSSELRRLVARGELAADEAVDRLSDAGDHGGRRDCDVTCPECGRTFWRSTSGRWNTCSDPCQIAWNTAIFDLDGGRTIVKISELTPERAAELLAEAGLVVGTRGRVVPS